MHIYKRPHLSLVNVTTHYIFNKAGKQVHLIDEYTHNTAQVREMLDSLRQSDFSFALVYANGGLPRSVEGIFELIARGNVPVKKLHLTKKAGNNAWDFWGDIPVCGHDTGFRFLILDEAIAFKAMDVVKMSKHDKVKEFMSLHKFTSTPLIRQNEVHFATETVRSPVLPDVFQRLGQNNWHIPDLGITLEITDVGMLMRRPLFPRNVA